MSTEPEFSVACLAYEEACSALEVARIELGSASTDRDNKFEISVRLDKRICDILNRGDSVSSRLYNAADTAHILLEQADFLLEQAEQSYNETLCKFKTASQAYMEEEAHLTCAALFSFDSEEYLQPHHQAKLVIFSLLRRGDSLKDWNLEHNDPVLKRLVVRELLSMVRTPEEF